MMRALGLIVALAIPLIVIHAAGEHAFTLVKAISFRHESSATSQKYLPETMGAGVALFDFNNDGRLDVFFTNGARLEDPMPRGKSPDKSDPKYWNRLFEQLNDGTFRDVTEMAALTGKVQNRYDNGVATGDFDNDGFIDLYVTAYGSNTLYRNKGDGTFEDVTGKAGVGGTGWSTSAGFFDYNNDGLLDLFVCRYVHFTFENNKFCGEKKPGGRSYCHPDNFAGVTNILYRNLGGGKFQDVSREAGIANPEGKSLGVAFADFDDDGWMDVFVANDSVPCFLYRNKRGGSFEDVSLTAGAGYNEDGKTFAGMGTDFSDFDNDGLPDIVVTDLSNERYVLFRNRGRGAFTDVTNESGIGRATFAFSGWSTRFLDFDNDGWKDLFVAQGHVMDNIEVTSPNLRYLQPPLLLKNSAGKFARFEAGPAFAGAWAGRGAAFGDLDNDGDVDVVVSNTGQEAYVLRNEIGSKRNWIVVEAKGSKSNRDAIGAKIRAVLASGLVQHYTVQTAAGYQSASDKRLVIGLGAEKSAKRVEIRWPSGAITAHENVPAGTTLRSAENAAK